MTTLLLSLLTVRPATLPPLVWAIGIVVFGAIFVRGWIMRERGE